jgi:hypothetical protein
MVARVTERIGCEGRQNLKPAWGIEQGGIFWQGLRPVARQRGEDFSVVAQEACQPDDACVAEAAQQHIGNCRRKLPVCGGEDFAAVDEMKIEPAHFAQG